MQAIVRLQPMRGRFILLSAWNNDLLLVAVVWAYSISWAGSYISIARISVPGSLLSLVADSQSWAAGALLCTGETLFVGRRQSICSMLRRLSINSGGFAIHLRPVLWCPSIRTTSNNAPYSETHLTEAAYRQARSQTKTQCFLRLCCGLVQRSTLSTIKHDPYRSSILFPCTAEFSSSLGLVSSLLSGHGTSLPSAIPDCPNSQCDICSLPTTSRYAFPPLLKNVIAKDMDLSQAQISTSNIIALLATLLVRLVAGPACDRFGPRWTFAGCLLIGAIPTFLSGTAFNFHQLCALRFFIGILGGSFVPCQVWTTGFYDKNIVGTANSLTAGFGNAGGGITYFAMPAIFNSLVANGLTEHVAWRVAFVVPGILIVTVAVLMLLLCPDTPTGKWSEREEAAASNARQQST